MTTPDDPLLDVARGDVDLSRQLSRSLRAAREATQDRGLRAVLDDVVSGRQGLRDATADPSFRRAAEAGAEVFLERWRAMNQDDRDELVRQGQQDLDRLAAEAAAEQPDEDDFGDPLGRRRGL